MKLTYQLFAASLYLGAFYGLSAENQDLEFSPYNQRTAMMTTMRNLQGQRPAKIQIVDGADVREVEYSVVYELFRTNNSKWIHYEMIKYSDGQQEESAYVSNYLGPISDDQSEIAKFEFREINLAKDIELDWVTRTGRLLTPVSNLQVVGFGTCDYRGEVFHLCIWPRETLMYGKRGLKVHTFWGGGCPYHIHDRTGYLTRDYSKDDLFFNGETLALRTRAGADRALTGDPLTDLGNGPYLTYSDLICEKGCVAEMQDLSLYEKISIECEGQQVP